MAAKIASIKQARRQRGAEVVKLICNCDATEGRFFRVTQIGDEVFAECASCWTEYGPWYVSPVQVTDQAEA